MLRQVRQQRRVMLVVLAVLLLIVGPTASAGARTTLPFANPPVSVSARATMALISFLDPGGTGGYAVEYDTDPGFRRPGRVNSTSTEVVLTELTSQTGYHLRTAAWDPTTGRVGSWALQPSFRTTEASFAMAPPKVTLSVRTATSLNAEWTEPGPELEYEVALGRKPDEMETVKATEKSAAILDNLEKTTTYYVSVRALANKQPVSAWAMPSKIKTPLNLPLKVATFNIKCNNCGGGAHSWARRKSAVVATIRSQMPDVLGIQEAGQAPMRGRGVSQFHDLLNGLGQPFAATYRPRIGGGAGVMDRIIYNTQTVTLLDFGTVNLPSRGARINRHMVWAKFRQSSTGKVFLFGNTHLQNGGGAAKLRVIETRAIINSLKRLSRGGVPTVMVGDFNTHKWKFGNKPYTMMEAAGFHDPLGNDYKSHRPGATAFVENRIRSNYDSSNRFERKAPRKSYANGTYIDYIFVTPMRVTEWETVVNVDSSGRYVGTIPSDHNMLRATVLLP